MEPLQSGVWGVLPTPFAVTDSAVDSGSLDKALELFVEAGVSGVVALGVFGEAAQLTVPERATVVQRATATFGARRVVVGLTSIDTDEVITEARAASAAAEAPLAALMIQINSTSAEAVVDHLRTVHTETDLPIVFQDYPIASGVRVTTELIIDILGQVDCISAVKCESPPTSLAIAQLAPHTSAALFGGLGGIGLLDELQAGAAGAMTGFSYPEVLVSVVDAWRDGGYAAARAAVEPWLPLINFEAQVSVGLSIRKENLRRRGVLASAAVRPPAMAYPSVLASLSDAHQHGIEGLRI
jgi:4-hydroxy-tetrahydrodipicolinate synthase